MTASKRPLDVAPCAAGAPNEVPPEPKKRKSVAQVYEKRCEAELEFKKEEFAWKREAEKKRIKADHDREEMKCDKETTRTSL
jgi:hypothetical protein